MILEAERELVWCRGRKPAMREYYMILWLDITSTHSTNTVQLTFILRLSVIQSVYAKLILRAHQFIQHGALFN